MNGSSENQPPRLTPRTGLVLYEPHGSFRAGTFGFARAVSFQVAFSPMVGNPPIFSSVKEQLKSVARSGAIHRFLIVAHAEPVYPTAEFPGEGRSYHQTRLGRPAQGVLLPCSACMRVLARIGDACPLARTGQSARGSSSSVKEQTFIAWIPKISPIIQRDSGLPIRHRVNPIFEASP